MVVITAVVCERVRCLAVTGASLEKGPARAYFFLLYRFPASVSCSITEWAIYHLVSVHDLVFSL